jgi:hypothetical protein
MRRSTGSSAQMLWRSLGLAAAFLLSNATQGLADPTYGYVGIVGSGTYSSTSSTMGAGYTNPRPGDSVTLTYQGSGHDSTGAVITTDPITQYKSSGADVGSVLTTVPDGATDWSILVTLSWSDGVTAGGSANAANLQGDGGDDGGGGGDGGD